MPKNFYKTVLFITLPLFFLTSCREQKENTSGWDPKSYYINIGEFPNLNAVKNYRINLAGEINQHADIQKISDKAYRILVGKYKSSYDAGKDAYRFLNQNLIKNYSIMKAGKEVLDEFKNILFVADYQERPSVYQFDLITKKSVIIWSRWGSKVVALNTSDDRSTAFITSVLAYGKKGGIPYLWDARTFILNRESNEYFEKSRLGDGVQLYTYWENPDTFKVNMTSVDMVNSRIVFQKIYPFDLNGNPGKIVERTFDLINNGFPLPPKRNPVYFSPNKRFQFRLSAFNNEYDIYLKDLKEKSEILVGSCTRKIADARWSEDGNYLFIVTVNTLQNAGKKKSQQTGELKVIDALQMKQVNSFTKYRYKNILVQGDFLLFDEQSNNSARINILDYRQNKLFYTISMPGGCGLNNLPR